MKERPVIFSGAMVRAILDGTKTQTRRVVKTVPGFWNYAKEQWVEDGCWLPTTPSGKIGTVPPVKCPYGVPKQRLWVREAWACHWANDDLKPSEIDSELWSVRYFADDIIRGCAIDLSKALLDQCQKRRSALFMPRWASRITLEIVSVRVERLQDISEDDAKAEGSKIAAPLAGGWWFPESFEAEGAEEYGASYANGYQQLWESIHGPGSWDTNPWVWCIEFKRVEVSA